MMWLRVVVGLWEGSVRQRRATSRNPAKTQHGSTRKPKRNKLPTAARPASSTLADLQQQVSALTRELAETFFEKCFWMKGLVPIPARGTLGGQGRRDRDRENSF